MFNWWNSIAVETSVSCPCPLKFSHTLTIVLLFNCFGFPDPVITKGYTEHRVSRGSSWPPRVAAPMWFQDRRSLSLSRESDWRCGPTSDTNRRWYEEHRHRHSSFFEQNGAQQRSTYPSMDTRTKNSSKPYKSFIPSSRTAWRFLNCAIFMKENFSDCLSRDWIWQTTVVWSNMSLPKKIGLSSLALAFGSI